jgi:predicted ATPase
MIRHVHIDHYKSISDVQLRLGGINVFVGSNSTGKSNFIDSIKFVRDCLVRGIDEAVSERHGIDSILQWSPTRPYNLYVAVTAENNLGRGQYIVRIGSKKREPYVIEEHGWWVHRNNPLQRRSFSRSKGAISFEGVKAPKQYDKLFSDVESSDLLLRTLRIVPTVDFNFASILYRELTSFEVYNIYPNTVREPQKPSRDPRLSANGDNLTSILKSMVGSKTQRVRNRYQEIISTMSKIIPELDRVIVRNVSGLLWPIFEVLESKGGHQFNVSQISDGALRMLGLLTAVYQPHPPEVIAIEEPEQNIHPGALALLAEAFKGLSPDTQFFLTTHSPHMIDYFDADEIFATDYRDGRTTVGPISKIQKDAIRDKLLSPGELMTAQGFELDFSQQ